MTLHPMATIEFENEILELIDNQNEFTRSDLQGCVTAIVHKIINGAEFAIEESKRYNSYKR